MSSYRKRSRRKARNQRQTPVRVDYKRPKPRTPGTSLARLARLAIHAAARKQLTKPRVVFHTTTQRTKSAPSTLKLKRDLRKVSGSWREPVTLDLAKKAMTICERKSARRAVLLAKSGGRGIKAPGPYRKHTEPCK